MVIFSIAALSPFEPLCNMVWVLAIPNGDKDGPNTVEVVGYAIAPVYRVSKHSPLFI